MLQVYRLASKPTSRPELQQDKERWAAEEGCNIRFSAVQHVVIHQLPPFLN
jgi:hypothetical protein